MAQACLACRTENRDGAKFCRGCGRRLVTLSPMPAVPSPREEWPATQRISLGNHAAALPTPPAARSPAPKARPAIPSSAPVAKSNAMRFVAIGFMLIAGLTAIGGWYAQREQAPEQTLSDPVREAPAAAPGVVAPPTPAASLSPPVAPQAVPVPAAAEALPGPAPAKAVSAAPKPRKTAPVVATPVPPPAIVAAPAPPPVRATAPEPAAPANPQASCAGLNFFARAQCMAAQCARPEHKAHAQCEAVRRQQQIDEERRNPSLMN